MPLSAAADPDVQLMLAVQRGDETAFQQLFEKHVRGAVGFAAQFVGVRARAEELVQDVFLQIYRSRARYEPRARFATWMYRMLTNACLSEVRHSATRARVESFDRSDSHALDDHAAITEGSTRGPEEATMNREALEQMQAALSALPPPQRVALLLARVEGLSYEEVAVALSCSVSAVKSLIHRATITLRERLRGVPE